MKKRLVPILLILLFVAGLLVFSSCNYGVAPVENIIVSTLPKISYYRGDPFDLSGAVLTVYYENGKTEIVPLSLTMVSEFDAQKIGSQTLTVSYNGKKTYIKVTIDEAPIYNISFDSTSPSYKSQYVQGQQFDTEGMKLLITYTNGYKEYVPIMPDMVSGFDSNVLGEQQIIINYQNITQVINVEVVRRSIKNYDIFAPNKITYIIGQKLNLEGGYLRVSYNDNTAEEIMMTDIYGIDSNFKILIDDKEDLEFKKSDGGTIVKVIYHGIEKLFTVRVEKIKVSALNVVTPPAPQVKNGTVDLSEGLICITYNNGDTENISMTDEIVSNNINDSQFNINVVGNYDVKFTVGAVSIICVVSVIEAKEDKLEIIIPEEIIYYQDSGLIDYTAWQYRIKLTNGSYRVLDKQGNTYAYLSDDENCFVKLDIDQSDNFDTNKSGNKTFVYKYTSVDKKIILTKTVSVNVIAKQLTEVVYFKAPTVATYMEGDMLNLVGGEIKFVYNSGAHTEIISLTRDMFDDEVWNNATISSSQNKTINFVYEDTVYNTSFTHSFNIKILAKISSISINASSSHSTDAIQGSYFDYSKLILDVKYPNGTIVNEVPFDSNEWTFINSYFENIGIQEVKVYYGDVNDISNIQFVSIFVNVTNNIVGISLADGFVDENGIGFADIIEGQTVIIGDNAYLKVDYENNDVIDYSKLFVKVTYSMLADAKSYNQVAGKREIGIMYQGFTVKSYVNVKNRKIDNGSIEIINIPDKIKYAKEDSVSLKGMKIKITYNNGGTSYITFTEGMLSYINGKENFIFEVNHDLVWEEGTTYKQRQISVKTTLTITEPENMAGGEDTVVFDTHWFDKLPEYITLLEFSEGEYKTLSAITAYEGINEIEFAQEAILRIMYNSATNDFEDFYLSDFYSAQFNYLSADKYELTGFNCNNAYNQTVTFTYLMYSCTFTVAVQPKILVELIADRPSVTVTEGKEIDSEAINITAHYVDALSREFENTNYGYVRIELKDLSSNYNPKTPVTFTNGKFITTVSFSFKDKIVTVELVILQKVLTNIIISNYPKQVYTEFYSDGINYENGMLIAYYNNGANEFIPLDSGISNLMIDSSEFDTNFEIINNNEVIQNIHIYYTVNGVQKSTSYIVTIKDRAYLKVDFREAATPILDGAFQYTYGVTKESRPAFYVMDGKTVFISNANIDVKIAENSGFSVKYRNSLGIESDSWPINAGLYTLIVRYDGDNSFNILEDSSMKIRINRRKIYINAEPCITTYGSEAPAFTWNITSGESDENILVFEQNRNDVLDIGFDIYLENVVREFVNNVVSLNVSSPNTDYKIMPKLIFEGEQFNNYQIVGYNTAKLTINPLDIIIKALPETKIYGQSDPTFKYDVYLYDGINNDVRIGGRYFDVESGKIVTKIIMNGYEIDISTYNLTRNMTIPSAQHVGEHAILAGSASFISNFNVRNYESASLTITKKNITVVGDTKTKNFGDATPLFTFRTLNSNDLAYGDTFNSIFGSYIDSNSYILSIYEESDIDLINNLVENLGGQYILPLSTGIGIYKVYLNIPNEEILNYNVNVEPVSLIINKANVKIFTKDAEIKYGDSNPEFIYGLNYFYEFEESYLLNNSYLISEFTRENGIDIGKYIISLTDECILSNSNFNISLYGENQSKEHSYIYIMPRTIYINRTDSGYETYIKKNLSELSVPYEVTTEEGFEIPSNDLAVIKNALAFEWVGRTARRQGTGIAVVDIYDGEMIYDYLLSKNYIPSTWMENLSEIENQRILNLIYNNVYNNMPMDSETIKINDDFVYEIVEKAVNIEILNSEIYNYNNVVIPLIYSDYSGYLCQNDIITITPEILVIYQDTANTVNAPSLLNAGVYTLRIADIDNFNYKIGNDTYTKTIRINPIEIKVVINETSIKTDDLGGIEYHYTNNTFDGRKKQPYDNVWVNNTDTETMQEKIAGKGYYYTESYKIVNSGLKDAPNSLTIYPYCIDGSGKEDYPKNAGVYLLKVNINETYKNYTVLFVDPSDYNQEAQYRYVINQRVVKLINISNYCNKIYDGMAPSIPSNASIYPDGDVTAEPVKLTDLTFSFTRDIEYVPLYLRQYINEDDKLSAGYFHITVNYSKSNNYTFELETPYYVIRRMNVSITLNSSDVILNKQFDKKIPDTASSALTFSGGTAASYLINTNNLKIDLAVKAFWNGSAWTTTIPINYDIGYYAYVMYPKIRVADDLYTGFEEEDKYDALTGGKLLDWNHTYTVAGIASSVLSGYGISGLFEESEGIYLVKPKNVILNLPGGEVKQRYVNDILVNAYIYYKPYNGQSITYTEALEFMNTYTVVDENYNIVSELNFNTQNMTCPSVPASIKDTGDYYKMNIDAIINANPNFNIVYQHIFYEIEKLKVELSIIFNNGVYGSSMVYGSGYENILYELDFNNKSAFISAMNLPITEAELDINAYLGHSPTDPNTFNISNNVYVLYNILGIQMYSSSNPINDSIPKGSYTPDVLYMPNNSKNFYFVFAPTTFEVMPKIITLNSIKRTYFKNDRNFDYNLANPIDSNNERNLVKNLLTELMEVFSDMTTISDSAGNYENNPNYYCRATKSDIRNVLTKSQYINYSVDYETYNHSEVQTTCFMALTVNKQELLISIKNDTRNPISMTYGHMLSTGEYIIYHDGFVSLSPVAVEYSYPVENGKQNEVKMFINNTLLQLSLLFTAMSQAPYDYGNLNTLNLWNYYDNSYDLQETLENYTVNLDKVYFIINKINIRLRLINNAGTTYNENSNFAALYSELESFVYSDVIYPSQRLSFNFEILDTDLASIIGYDSNQSYTLIDLLMLMNVKNKDISNPKVISNTTMLMNAIDYFIRKGNDRYTVLHTINEGTGMKNTTGNKVTAGTCQIALTNDWYNCLGYNITCEYSTLYVYPEVSELGCENEYGNYVIPYCGVALIGAEKDISNFTNNLSMYVRLNYIGMNPGLESEWIDIKITELMDSNLYLTTNYIREWQINVLSGADSLIIGGEATLKLTFIETFFYGSDGAVSNTIATPEFKVRLYNNEDQNLIDGNSYFTYGTQIYNYGDKISANHTYTLGTYVQSPSGSYLQKNWKGNNYYIEIADSFRYTKGYANDSEGEYLYAILGSNPADYYLILPSDRFNIEYVLAYGGKYQYANIDGIDTYIEILIENKYKNVSGTWVQDNSGTHIKYTVAPGDDRYILLDGNTYNKLIKQSQTGNYLKISLDGIDYYEEITSSNRYRLYTQDNNGNYLLINLFSNISYEEILSENRYEKSSFSGIFDILDTRFRIQPNSGINDYYVDFILFNNGTHNLYLKINRLGYYLFLNGAQIDYEVSLAELDLFDNYSHSMTIYIDKIGSNPQLESDRYYYVILIIDDCYYLKLQISANNLETFGADMSLAAIVTNEVSITFTKYEAIAMGINSFSANNYIADILLLPNQNKPSQYKNYSYHITIPDIESIYIEVDLSKLFILGSINSSFGYSAQNYYYRYYVDGECICSTQPNNAFGSTIRFFERGIYSITIEVYLKYTGDPYYTYYSVLSKSIKLSISQNYNMIGLEVGRDENNDPIYEIPSVKSPITYNADSSQYLSYYSENSLDISYNKIVFDFLPNEGSISYYLRFVLKAFNTSTEMLDYSDTDGYYGLMVENNGGITKIYMRYMQNLWEFDLGAILNGEMDAWIGQRNVLETLYVANNSYFVITLRRGNYVIFSQKIYKNSPLSNRNISAEDISNVINTGPSYTGIIMHDAEISLYKYEVGYRMLGAIDFVNNDDNSFVSGISTIGSDTKILISNADGTAYTSTGKHFYIKFKASALDNYNTTVNEELIRFVIVNNTAELMPMTPYNDNTLLGTRGVYLSIINISKTTRELRLYMYKYNRIYKEQTLFSFEIGSEFDLLNGEEHTILTKLTNIEGVYTSQAPINCYQINVFIDNNELPLFGFYPQLNNMNNWIAINKLQTENNDDESSNDDKDVYFVSNVVYSGIITLNSIIFVEELAIC